MAVALTEYLHVDPTVAHFDPDATMEQMDAGQNVFVPSAAAARVILERVGLNPAEVAEVIGRAPAGSLDA
ncbi:MAG: hypothetical protein NVS3B1_19700 [Marmoricola sp.]